MEPLRHVGAVSEIEASLRVFNNFAQTNRSRSVNLLRQTSYWVFDEKIREFGPSKFVGLANITFETYEAATRGDWSGDLFDGHATRNAIEKATASLFGADAFLTVELVKWGEALFGSGVFDGIDEAKWCFLKI